MTEDLAMTEHVALAGLTLDELARHAEDEAPREACGLVLRSGAYVACRNRQDELHALDPRAHPRSARHGFVLDGHGARLLAFGVEGDDVIAVVHSHPNGMAYLSARDRAGATDGDGPMYPVDQVVVGVAASGRTTEVASYRFDESAREFREVARARRVAGEWQQSASDPAAVTVRLLSAGGGADVDTRATAVEDAVAAALAAGAGAEALVLDPSTGSLRVGVRVEIDGEPATDGQLLSDGSEVTVRLAQSRARSRHALTIHDNVHDTFAPTPLIDVSILFDGFAGRVLLKYEPATPTGSHKYRAARAAMDEAVRGGYLRAGHTALAPTGGNYGLALAALARSAGMPCTLALPDNYPTSKIRLLQLAGADVVLADHTEGPNAHGVLATEILWSDPARFCLFDQFSDPANIEGHVSTADEVLDATEGARIDCFVAGIGSGASLTGIGRTLLDHHPSLQIVGVQPEGCDVLAGDCVPDHGIPGLAVGGPPANLDVDLVSAMATVTRDAARSRAVHALASAGVNVGISTGANLAAVSQMLATGRTSRTVLTLAYDRLDSYLDIL
jgi:cysteine synthase A